MKIFIPDNVPAEKIFYMPATTDPLDGLNKPLTEEQMSTYLKLFNALLLEDGQKPLDEQRHGIDGYLVEGSQHLKRGLDRTAGAR